MAALAAIATAEVHPQGEAPSAPVPRGPGRARVLALPQARVRLEARPQAATFTLSTFAGRLIELSSTGASAGLGFTALLLAEAQRQGEPAAWLQGGETLFFPPDLAAVGVDLAALPIVRPPAPGELGKALTHLLRSGAFGLVVVDLQDAGAQAAEHLPPPLQSRVERLAQTHGACVLCLTSKGAEAPSLGPLVSWRGEARRVASKGVRARVETLRDKRGAAGWDCTADFEPLAGLS